MVDLHFKYPATIAWLGLLTTTTASFVSVHFLLPPSQRARITMRHYMSQIMPTGFFMALTFVMGNVAYLYLTVAFVQMLKAFCPVVTMMLLFVARLERPMPRLIASVCVISAGVAMASWGEAHMSVVGVTAMMTSVVSECVRLVLTQYLLAGGATSGLHPLEGLMYIGSASTFWLMVQAATFEWGKLLAARDYLMVPEHPAHFAAAALAGFGVNGLAILVIKLSSSLTLKVLGTVKDAALVMVGVMFLHEKVTLLQGNGYAISLVGFVAYNVIKAQGSMSKTTAASASEAKTA